jgi:hypothetical protein
VLADSPVLLQHTTAVTIAVLLRAGFEGCSCHCCCCTHVRLQVEAEEVDDVTEQYGVTTVPYFVMLQVRCQRIQQV